ncbi:MAG: hypothetical protein H7Y17_00510 [Chlorobia bacterium]|nr:hypothetical protein [Fimbriimonadaceae bacterium]
MESEETKPKRRTALWVTALMAAVLFGAGIWITREPPLPFQFLDKYPLAEKRSSRDGRLRIVVLRGDINDIWSDIRREYSGKRTFSSNGLMNVNGNVTEYRSLGTEDGLIKVSNDLSFANDGFGHTLNPTEVKPGYCAVAFTRPKTIFDRALEWIRRQFARPAANPTSSPTIHV